MWLWVSMSPGAITPFVSMTVAPAAPGSAAHAVPGSTQVMLVPSTST